MVYCQHICIYIGDHKKSFGPNFQCKTIHGTPPSLGVCFEWNAKKRLKIAHLGIFRHIGQGGSAWSEKVWTSKYSGSRTIVPKTADLGHPGAPQSCFQKKNPVCSNYLTPRHISITNYQIRII